jgi:hypothetical protein
MIGLYPRKAAQIGSRRDGLHALPVILAIGKHPRFAIGEKKNLRPLGGIEHHLLRLSRADKKNVAGRIGDLGEGHAGRLAHHLHREPHPGAPVLLQGFFGLQRHGSRLVSQPMQHAVVHLNGLLADEQRRKQSNR